ncbi:NEDD4-binding protein 2-like 2 isoform X1 [Suricata suricatta]|uniref:NEDD4 binding protein 2 like 2 n=1 Tax=Suricata suricatta TaxID=37032 RepID=A0A673TAY2_SURSU|nr:NEDD4-binding protein 2-like 2 isoform X1 [Suricata suricatta]
MPYGEIEVKSLDHGEELTSEPCYKKLKSTEEAYVFSHHGSANFHRIPQNTGNDWVPVTTVDVRGHSSQEDKTKATDSLKSVREEVPGHNRPDVDVIESTDAQILQDAGPPLVSTDDEIYSTSKAFIGPIYKPPEKRKCNEARNQSDIINGIADKGRVQKQKLNSKESELDNELFQFYKEIEELENDKDDSEGSCREPEPSEEHLTAYHQGHNNDLLKSEEGKKRDISDVLQSHCDFQQHMGNEPCKYPCNGQVIPAFCHDSFTSFRPEWQSVHSFIVPPGPPLPSFNYHLNSQRFSASPNPSSSILHAQDGSQLQNGCYVNSCHVNWNCLTFHQNNDYIDCSENTSRAHSSTNGYSVQDGYVSNGFYEASEGCWKDPTDNHNGTDRLMSQQFQEEKLNKLQKLLILLRGLPGSGKTTLSRILLGQSRDGIVFSTDDYFHHQDGYRYNVNQLGDAHDWNQNRAKQAINQGRSPVIIDNTNTQAWEMKPYVEMAIGKGYRVEFHEPETWWKFDPEELEKRNKHGVSRKKIAQMLDRYEYEMSISIVMNSVEPSHKSTQRPPPSQGRQRESDLKKTGHRFSKNKQKRNRKRSKKQNSHGKIMGENSFETLHYHTPGDQDPSQSEEEDVDDTKRESACAFTGGLGSELRDLVNSPKDAIWKSVNPEDCFPNVISAVKLDNTPKNYPPKEHDDLFPSMSLMPNENSVTCPTMTQNLSCTASDEWPGTKVGKDAVDRHPPASDVQDGSAAIPCSFVQKRERGDKRLLNETFLCNQYGPRTSDKSLRKDQGINTTENDYWAFFSNNLSDEELQLSSERQPCFESWPEGPHKFICEQRPKRDRWQRLASLDSRGQVIKLISTSEGTSRPGSSPETSLEEKLLIENEDLSPPTEDIDSVIETETNVFRSCLPKLDIPKSDLCSTKNKKRKQKRVFNLAPNFNLREPRYIDVKERGDCSMLTETHGLKIILEAEKDRISEISSIEENKQKLTTFDHHPSWFCFDIIKGPPLSFGTQSYSRYLPFSRLRHPVYFYKNPIPSLVLQYTSSFWMVSFTSKKPSLTFKSQTRVGNQLNDIGLSSSEILSSQPDPLYSFRVTSDLHFLNESFDEKLKTGEEPKPLRFLQTEDNQDITSTGFDSLELQLSQGFAFQLVKLFGSPGVPMESLLPDDYVVSVDWETLKMIYLQWKTSVEKRQKKIG